MRSHYCCKISTKEGIKTEISALRRLVEGQSHLSKVLEEQYGSLMDWKSTMEKNAGKDFSKDVEKVYLQ